MGAWGTGNWQNDDALDWIEELQTDANAVHAALQAVGETPILGAGGCCRALAAAEIVTACFGQPGEGLPDEAKAWVAKHATEVPRAFVTTAIGAVTKLDSKSELQVLFDEDGRNAEWHAAVGSLRERLESIGA